MAPPKSKTASSSSTPFDARFTNSFQAVSTSVLQHPSRCLLWRLGYQKAVSIGLLSTLTPDPSLVVKKRPPQASSLEDRAAELLGRHGTWGPGWAQTKGERRAASRPTLRNLAEFVFRLGLRMFPVDSPEVWQLGQNMTTC